MSEKETVKKLKKLNESGIICQHLNTKPDHKLGFNVPRDIENDIEAWCNQCELVLQEENNEWTERAQNFANLKSICRCCFESLRTFYTCGL